MRARASSLRLVSCDEVSVRPWGISRARAVIAAWNAATSIAGRSGSAPTSLAESSATSR